MVVSGTYPETGFWEADPANLALLRLISSAIFPKAFQPTTQPAISGILYDFRELWQSPRFCK
jgi:hypothetical protein